MLNNFSGKSTNKNNEIISYPYASRGVPISVPIISKFFCEKGYCVRRKHTNLYCFEFVISGVGYVSRNGQIHKVQAGDLYIIYGHEPHLYYTDKDNPMVKYSICAYGDFIKKLLECYNITETSFHRPNCAKYFIELLDYAKQQPNYIEVCKQTALTIHKIISYIHDQPESIVPAIIKKAQAVLNNAVEKSFDLNNLCQELHISKPNLIKQFKRYYGCTPYDYLLSLKMHAAQNYLAMTDLSVSQIAERLKFNDAYYFSNIFKKKNGISPLKYRKQL